jgi:hypothetical protein
MEQDTIVELDLTFSFPFFNQSFSAANLSSDGFLTFEPVSYSSSSAYTMKGDSAPWNIISFFWLHLQPHEVYYGGSTGAWV